MGQSGDFRVEDFFVLRTPALPLGVLDSLRDEFANGIAVSSSSAMHIPFVREAIFLASPNLYRRLSESGIETDGRFQMSLGRYLCRMGTRCTPFGLFAGVTEGAIGRNFALTVEASENSKRVCRLDLGAVTRLQSALFREQATAESLGSVTIVPNTSLWHASDGLRYVEAQWAGSAISYKLARVEHTPALQTVLDLTSKGQLSFDAVAQDLSRAFAAPTDTTATFLLQLVEAQILSCASNVQVTGDDVTADFVQEVLKVARSSPIGAALAEAQRNLAAISEDSQSNILAYSGAAQALKAVDGGIDDSMIVQVDLHKPAVGTELPQMLAEDILDQLWSLRALLATREIEELARFRLEFEDRFGDARVPLLRALDEDFGVRIGISSTVTSPLLDGFPSPGHNDPKVTLNRADLLLLRLAQASAHRGSHEIEITDEDLKEITDESDSLPSSFSIVGSLSCEVPQWTRDGNYRFHLNAISGIPSSSLMGRFCCGNAGLTQRVRALIERNEADTASSIVAEVVHLPEGRIGNVMLRPVLRNYEITYLGKSGAQADRQIDARDLEIFLQNGELVLFSTKLGKRIIPRITNAQSFFTGRTLPVYRLLGLLQYQGEACPRPILGDFAESVRTFPAIRYRNIVLRGATALLTEKDTKHLAQMLGSSEAPGASVLEFLAQRGIGHRLRVRSGDSFLELDLREKFDQALFLEECRRNKTLSIESMDLFHQDLARDRAGNALRQEIVIPVSRAKSDPVLARPLSTASNVAAASPGGEWLYARVFCGSSVADRLVADVFPAFAACAKSAGCRKPFFIRYDQHGAHLRIRVQGPAETVWGAVREEFEGLIRAKMSNGEIARAEYGTYFPEASRYGGPSALESCENIFSKDSEAVAAAMAAVLAGADPEGDRWRFALASVVALLGAFGFSAERQVRILNEAFDAFAFEFRVGKAERKAMNAKYREERGFIDNVLDLGTHPVESYSDVLNVRTTQIAPHIERLKTEAGDRSLDGVVRSLLHMAVNRIFSDRARLNEMLLLHFIAKSLSSIQGRAEFSKSHEGRRPTIPE